MDGYSFKLPICWIPTVSHQPEMWSRVFGFPQHGSSKKIGSLPDFRKSLGVGWGTWLDPSLPARQYLRLWTVFPENVSHSAAVSPQLLMGRAADNKPYQLPIVDRSRTKDCFRECFIFKTWSLLWSSHKSRRCNYILPTPKEEQFTSEDDLIGIFSIWADYKYTSWLPKKTRIPY